MSYRCLQILTYVVVVLAVIVVIVIVAVVVFVVVVVSATAPWGEVVIMSKSYLFVHLFVVAKHFYKHSFLFTLRTTIRGILD